MSNSVLDTKIVGKYKEVALNMLHYSFPNLSYQELNSAIDYSIMKRNKDDKAEIVNNYKKEKIDSTLLEITEYILAQEPIMCAYGVLFQKHDRVANPLARMVEKFLATRKIHKKEMFKYPKGTEMFRKFNLLQLLDKIDSNGLYGVLGQYSSIYYNIYVAAGITTQGRSSISASILLFESFLADNCSFGSLDEVVTFINNIVTEKRTYDDKVILDENIDVEEAYYKIMRNCAFNYVPDEEDLQIVWDIMCNLTQEDINRLFYKNNLYSFMDNKVMSNAIVILLQKLESPYLDPNSVPKEIEVELDEFWHLLKEYVYYSYQTIDKLDKVEMMMRDVAIIIDTDSSILCLDSWYRYVLDKVYNIPMNIKTELIDPIKFFEADEFGDVELTNAVEFVEPEYEYNFYTDEMIELERTITPAKIVPQESLRYSIINIMCYCLSQMLQDFFIGYTKGYNSYSENKPCYLNMKNEFFNN